jgi:6-phosphogluconate dehydrogenase
MEPGFTQEEINKITLSSEELEHFSKPAEIKRLLLERNFYKKVIEHQNKNINVVVERLNSILDAPITTSRITYFDIFGFKKTKLITKSARDIAFEYQLNQLANKLCSINSIEPFQYNFKIE